MTINIENFVKETLIRSTNDLSSGATDKELSNYLSQYDESQAEGVLNNIKGITHELYYEHLEDTDGDAVLAEVFPGTNHSGSDIILENIDTGKLTEIQLKATNSSEYVREALEKYPDIEIYATSEVANELGIESTGISNFELTREVQDTLDELGLEGFDDEVLNYVNEINNDMTPIIDSDTSNSILDDTMGDFYPDMINAFAAGGYLALLDILKNDPVKQKKVMKAGVALGMFDGVFNIEDMRIEDGFDMNPLFIASIATWISMLASNSSNAKVKSFGRSFNMAANLTFKTLEVGGYVAIGAEILDVLTPGIEIVDTLGDMIESVDIFDAVANGADLVDGVATLGLGIAASKGVKYLCDKWTEGDEEKIQKLRRKVANKKFLRSMVKSNVPPALLAGPLSEME